MKMTPFNLQFVKYGEGEAAPETENVFDDDFFDGLLDDQLDEPAPESQPSEGKPTPEEGDPKSEEVEAPAPEQKPAEVKPQGEAQPKTEEQPAAETQLAAPTTTPPATEPQQLDLNHVRGELEKAYALTDDQADMLTTDPQKIFPQLAAQLHMQVMAHVLRVFEAALPQQIESLNQRQTQYQQVEGQFKQLYPDLDLTKPEVYQAVGSAAELIKKQFPTLSMDEKVKRVGLLAHSLLGTQIAPAPAAAALVQAAPRPTPVSPAPARSSAPVRKPGNETEWDRLLSELKDED